MKILKQVCMISDFSVYYIKALVEASLRIAYDVIMPGYRIKPGFIAIPLKTQTDLEILLYANLDTMTPGTLSLDVTPDRRILYVHAMYIHDVEEARLHLGEHLQNRVLEVLRC